MKTLLFYITTEKWILSVYMLLLLFTSIQVPAVSQTQEVHELKYSKQAAFTHNQANTYLTHYTFSNSQDSTRHAYLHNGLSATDEKSDSPMQEKLTVNIHPQPAENNGGDMYLSFNRSVAQELHITIGDMLGKRYYHGWHPAEEKLFFRFGQHLPVLAPGSYQLTVVAENQVVKKIFTVQ